MAKILDKKYDVISSPILWKFLNAASYTYRTPIIEKPLLFRLSRIRHHKFKIMDKIGEEQNINDIDLSQNFNEIAQIQNIIKTIQFSTAYKDLVRTVIQRSLDNLIHNLDYFRDYPNRSVEEQQNFLQYLHNDAMSELVKQFPDQPELTDNFTPTPVTLKTNPETERASGHQSLFSTNIEAGKNTSPIRAVAVLYHETTHRIEHIWGTLYYENKSIIPRALKEDAALIFLGQTSSSYIPPAFLGYYAMQYNENLAIEISHLTIDTLKKAVSKSDWPEDEKLEFYRGLEDCLPKKEILDIAYAPM